MEHNMTTVPSHQHGLPIGNEGLLLSHSFLGTFVIGLGFWWWIQSIRQQLKSIRIPTGKYEAQASYKSGCCADRIGEGLVKLLLSVIGLSFEAFTERLGRHHEYAHYPFYTSMLVAGLVDVLQSTVLFLPDGIDYLCHALPFVFQAYCLRAQAYEQPHVTATCRHISSYIGVITAFSIIGEMGIRSNFIMSWIKCFTVMLSGAWTWQMGIILNPIKGDPWPEENHDYVMQTAVLVAWQMFIVGVVQLVTLLIVAKCQGVSADWMSSDREWHRTSNDRDHTQYVKLLNNGNSEE